MTTFDGALLQRIGDGPVATVYSGQKGGAPVALKVFPKRLDKRTVAAFTKEQAKLSATRKVSSILLVDGVDELDTGEFAVRMERCTQSLAALVDRVGAVPPADVVVLGCALANALTVAHACGVVHGGISPHNVLFRTTGEPVLADFGVTLRQAFARDPLYAIEFLPPETLRTGVLNERTDLYGLGAVLHYALAGRSPHPGRLGEQPGERVLRILGEPVPALNASTVPTELSTIVARLLCADPIRRLGDAGAVADQLGAMLPDAPRRPVADDFDDFGAARSVRPPQQAPTRSLPPPRYVPGDGDDFDDFAGPGHRSGPPSPVFRPATPPPAAAAQLHDLRREPPQPAPVPLAVDPVVAPGPPPVEPLAPPPVPAPGHHVEETPTEALPQSHTVRFQQPKAVPGQDEFDFGDLSREHNRTGVKLLATVKPDKKKRNGLVRYDLLAGVALLIALLAMVPLLLLRGDPEEIPSAPHVPAVGGGGAGGVEVVLDHPVDMTNKVRLTWTAPADLDFAVVVAVEGQKEPDMFLVGRVYTNTVEVVPGRRYCFQVRATDGRQTYVSNSEELRGATCRE